MARGRRQNTLHCPPPHTLTDETIDYKVLLTSFELTQNMDAWPRQRIIHACLRNAIVGGSLACGTRLLASRALAGELGIARNTVLYA